MLALGTYWCSKVYRSWSNQPVLTTITTAELPVDKVKINYKNDRALLFKKFRAFFEYVSIKMLLKYFLIPHLKKFILILVNLSITKIYTEIFFLPTFVLNPIPLFWKKLSSICTANP